MKILIKPLATPTPHKLAEAELCFDEADGLLQDSSCAALKSGNPQNGLVT